MSDLPPTVSSSPPYPMNPPAGVSGAAVTSLVLGVLLCVPLVTSLGAIIFALVGMHAASTKNRRGKGIAIAGLILGIIGVIGWAGVGGVSALLIHGSAAPRAVLHDFANKLVAGDTSGALAISDPVVTREDFDKLHAELVPLGAYRDLTCYNVLLSTGTHGKTCTLTGSMHFAGREQAFRATVIQDPSGAWKIYGFRTF